MLTNDQATAILWRYRNELELEVPQVVHLEPIGRGEANLNLLLMTTNGRSFNLRIGMRGAESVTALHREFRALRMLPAGIGPRAYAYTPGDQDLTQPYLLLDYLEGEIKADWSEAEYRAHAVALARLHRQRYRYHGDLEQPSTAPFDLVAQFDDADRYWQQREPTFWNLPQVRQIAGPLRAYLVAHNEHFRNLRHFSLIHGDMHRQNILHHQGDVRYIDWEWAGFGDPACDIAKVGWDVATAWQLELRGDQLEQYLAAYRADAPDPTLPLRRECWMLFTMYFDQIYHRTQLANDPHGHQAFTVNQLERYLLSRFAG